MPIDPPSAFDYALAELREQKGDLKTWVGFARTQILLAAACLGLLLPQLIAAGADACRLAVANAGWWWVASIFTTFMAFGAMVGLQSFIGTEMKQHARAASLGEPVHVSKHFATWFRIALVLAYTTAAVYAWSFAASLGYTSQSVVCVALR